MVDVSYQVFQMLGDSNVGVSSSGCNAAVRVGKPLDFVLSANDPDGDPISYEARRIPEDASFDTSRAHFSWRPT
jgi:hypothetical protein